MPAALITFTASTENPTGHLAPDGSLYVRLSGNAAILLHVCPELLRAPSGGRAAGEAVVDLNDLIYILGRVTALEPEVLDLALGEYTISMLYGWGPSSISYST